MSITKYRESNSGSPVLMSHSMYVSTFPIRTFLSGLVRLGNVGCLFFPAWNLDGDGLKAGLSLSVVLMPVSLLIMFTRLKLLR